ncbi:hypothetical protein BH11BAC7_BH11BAC7_07420 [soil metagenome]
MSNLNFKITPAGQISKAFLERNIYDFQQACGFVKKLPYRRNSNKDNMMTVFSDECGTCGTKHALLKQLAHENELDELKLIVGLFNMNARNTPQVSETLFAHKLEYVPEAHCYLRFDGEIIDCTKTTAFNFVDDLIEEMEISQGQVSAYKEAYQKAYLKKWLLQNTEIKFTLDEFWAIREQCIMDISMK